MDWSLIIFVVVVIIFAWRGFRSGFIRSLGRVCALVAGYVAAIGFAATLAPSVEAQTGIQGIAAFALASLGLFVGAGLVVMLIFALLLMKGAWDFWAPYAELQPTSGRWFPTGFDSVRGQGWYEVNDIPLPEVLRWMEGAFNDGDEYEKIPRMIPYAVLPLSMALLLFRFVQAAIAIWTGKIDRIVASHEVEDEMAEVREQSGGQV